MSVEWFDLAARLRAEREQRPVARLLAAPFAAPGERVAVRATQDRTGQITLSAAHPALGVATATGAPDVLALLARFGVSAAQPCHATLVVDDRTTLSVLDALARTVEPGTAHADVAAHVGWSAARADVNGTSAVAHLPSLCAATWYVGEAPHADRQMRTWRHWLGVPDDSVAGLLPLLDRLTARGHLARLDQVREDDCAEWLRARRDTLDGYDWRTADHVGRAAVGLAARSAAAEVHRAALLSDPLYRRRAVHTGEVVEGRLTASAAGTLTVQSPRLDARLRAGNDLTCWAGTAGYEPRRTFAATVKDTEAHGLALVLRCTTSRRAPVPPVGARVVLMPASPHAKSIAAAKSNYARLYATRTSWLTTGRTPTPARRDVPLEVLVAAADPED